MIDDGAGPLKVPNPAFKFAHSNGERAKLCASVSAPTTRRFFRVFLAIPKIESRHYTKRESFATIRESIIDSSGIGGRKNG